MKIHFLNVGNGDCTVLELPDNKIMVIDICNCRLKKEEAKKEFVNPLDYLVSISSASSVTRYIQSHPDMDHMDGLADLISKYSISNFWDTQNKKQKPDEFTQGYREKDWDAYEELRKGKSAKYFSRGDIIESDGVKIHVLSPSAQLVKDSNDNEDWNLISYVIILEFRGLFVAFGGDASDVAWENIHDYATSNTDVKNLISKVNIFKASHHGRNTSYCGSGILDMMNPKYIVISKGSVPGEQSAYGNYYNWCDKDAKRLFLTSKGTIIADFDEAKGEYSIKYSVAP